MVIQIDDSHPSIGPCTIILLNGEPWELLEHYDVDDIETFFLSLPEEHRIKVLVYVCDTAPFLLRLGRKFFPNARLVVDPFHVIRDAIKCFDKILQDFETPLIKLYKRAIKEGELVRPQFARRKRKLLRGKGRARKQKEPTVGEIQLLFHTKRGDLNQEHGAAVRFLLRSSKELRPAYFFLHGLMALYHRTTSANKASRRFDKLFRKLPAELQPRFEEFTRYCYKHRQAICEFWRCGWTNAEVEAQNGVIADIDRRARGLKFAELRRRWLYGESATKTLKRRKTSPKLGPKKKEIRELRALPPRSPVPVAGPHGQMWLFDQDDDDDEEPKTSDGGILMKLHAVGGTPNPARYVF